MQNKFIYSVIALVCTYISFTWGAGLTACESERERVTLEGSDWITAPAQELTSLVRTIRMPEDGFYDSELSCITVADMHEEENQNTPEIIEGGVGYKFVTIKATSAVGKALNYLVLCYSNNVTATTLPNLNARPPTVTTPVPNSSAQEVRRSSKQEVPSSSTPEITSTTAQEVSHSRTLGDPSTTSQEVSSASTQGVSTSTTDPQ